MACLGRLVMAFVMILLLAAGWLYRDELTRWGRGIVDPMSAVRRTGTPSATAMDQATVKIGSLGQAGTDSIVLTASEFASLVVAEGNLLGITGIDSVSVELGDRTIRVRTMLATDRLPERLRTRLPAVVEPYEEVILKGEVVPARPGVGEWRFEQVLVRGVPLPAELVTRVVGEVTGRQRDGRLEILLPAGVAGFRVRPEGVAIYRGVP
jgi:hypothetical protein